MTSRPWLPITMTFFFGSDSNPAQRLPSSSKARPPKPLSTTWRLWNVAVFWSIGGSVLSARQASTVDQIEWVCITQRACGQWRWIAPCSPHAVGSGASVLSSVPGSSASSNNRSEARMREKCLWLGLIRNLVPVSFTARLKWFATASCSPSRAVQRKTAARSARSCARPVSAWVSGARSSIGSLRSKGLGATGREHLVAGLLGLVIDQFGGKARCQDLQAGRILRPADDVGRQLALAVTVDAVLEDADQQRADLKRHIRRLGDLVEQADILFYQVHREGDIARAVQDQLAFGFMHEGCARRDLHRLIRGVEIHAGGLHRHQRLAAGQKICGGQIIGHDLQNRGRADLASVKDPAPQCGQGRQHALEGGAIA